MRVTAEQKIETRRRIVEEALQLFDSQGFDETTTRDIARAAGIAAGTLFNYFSSKEALAMSVFAEALEQADAEARPRLKSAGGLAEAVFAYVASGLRRLEPYRHFVGAVFERTMTPFAIPGVCVEADEVRAGHLDAVWTIMADRAGDSAFAEFEPLTSHLYWSLYLGVVAFWSRDDSPHQEDTLAMLDRTTQLFAQSLRLDESPDATNANEFVDHGTHSP